MADAAKPPAKKAVKAKKPTVKPAHPKYADMIVEAIKALKERKDSSRKAILKYIVANHKIADVAKAQVRVKLAVRKLVADKKIIAGKGVNCAFKLPKEAAKPKKVKKAKKPEAKKAKKPAKKPAAKKA
ncbi:unnamed protein product, partial [Meganyctiphanes norvegica]